VQTAGLSQNRQQCPHRKSNRRITQILPRLLHPHLPVLQHHSHHDRDYQRQFQHREYKWHAPDRPRQDQHHSREPTRLWQSECAPGLDARWRGRRAPSLAPAHPHSQLRAHHHPCASTRILEIQPPDAGACYIRVGPTAHLCVENLDHRAWRLGIACCALPCGRGGGEVGAAR